MGLVEVIFLLLVAATIAQLVVIPINPDVNPDLVESTPMVLIYVKRKPDGQDCFRNNRLDRVEGDQYNPVCVYCLPGNTACGTLEVDQEFIGRGSDDKGRETCTDTYVVIQKLKEGHKCLSWPEQFIS